MHNYKLNFLALEAPLYIAHPRSPKALHPNVGQNTNQLTSNTIQLMKNANQNP
jgi:hypothetical protein